MTIREAIDTGLKGYAGLSSLVGTRIYAVRPKNEPSSPYVVFALDPQTPFHQFGADPTAAQSTLQVWACADTNIEDAQNVAAQVVAFLERFTGLMGGSGGVTILGCLSTDLGSDDYDFDSGIWMIPSMFQVTFSL